MSLAVPAGAEESTSGRFITLRGAVDSAMVQRTLAAIRDVQQSKATILLCDLQLGQSEFGSCYDLANALAQVGGSVQRTVAYVSKPLAGNAILVALACDEIVLAPGASIGPVSADADLKPREKSVFESIAMEKGHGKWIATGLADRSTRLVEVDTPAGKGIKTGEELAEFEKNVEILRRETIKEAGSAWILSPEVAQRIGLARLVLESRREVAMAYELPEQVAAEDQTFKEAAKPARLRIDGPIHQRAYVAMRRRLSEAESRDSTILFVEIDSTGGEVSAAASLMEAIERFPGYKVAYVPKSATGAATLLLFACDELVVGPDAVIGDFPAEGDAGPLAEAAVQSARDSKFPQAIVRGMVDPAQEVVVVKQKNNPALRGYRTTEELSDPEIAKDWEVDRVVKKTGEPWIVRGAPAARDIDLAVGSADSFETLGGMYNVAGSVRPLEATWVDSLVDGLTSPGVTVFLLVLGLTCLYIEFQMPGFGIAGLLSALCFVLFFWSRFLSETANSLEIVMFIVGLILLSLELFVFPGFGFIGLTGIGLLLASLILASQSFPWPTSESERQILLGNILQVAGSLVLFTMVAVAIARFFPSLPMFQRMMLQPPGTQAEEWTEEDFAHSASPADALLGQVGVASSHLRPAGRMLLGGRYWDVMTAGEFIEPGRQVEIVEVYSNRIVVRGVDPRVS
jgi:membrane-bound serine protease (ClpP class)